VSEPALTEATQHGGEELHVWPVRQKALDEPEVREVVFDIQHHTRVKSASSGMIAGGTVRPGTFRARSSTQNVLPDDHTVYPDSPPITSTSRLDRQGEPVPPRSGLAQDGRRGEEPFHQPWRNAGPCR